MKLLVAFVGVCTLAVTMHAQTASLGVRVMMSSERVTGVYKPDVKKVCDETAVVLISLLKTKPQFSAWNLTTAKSSGNITFTFQERGAGVSVVAALTDEDGSIGSWEPTRLIDSLPAPGKDAAKDLATLVIATVVDERLRQIMHEGLAQISFSSRPPLRSKTYPRSFVLPVPADDAGAVAALRTASFRVVCEYEGQPDLELLAVNRPKRKEAYNGGVRASYNALVALGRKVDDQDIDKWQGNFDKLKPLKLYLHDTESSDVRLASRN